jgi:hypothetical protein
MEQQQAAETISVRSAGIRYGLISAVFSIVYFLVLRMTGVDMNGPAQWLGWLVGAVFIFLAQKYYKDNGDGYMDYSQGIGVAFWMGLISSLISSAFTYIYIKFVDTAFLDYIAGKQMEEFQKNGMSDEQIDQAVKMSKMFMTPEVIAGMGLVMGIIGTVLIALIVTLITQKRRPDFGGALDS